MTISVRAFAPDRERRAAAFEEAPNWLTQHGELNLAHIGHGGGIAYIGQDR
jgi:hypothetical protein